MLPEGYNMEKLGSAWQEYSNIINHHKYANNYDYNKSILLINQEAHLDFGYLLARESSEIFSPISVLNFSYYNEESKLKGILELKKNEIQCIVGKEIPFGKAQMPELWDYADGLDTMKFLESI